MKLSKETKVVAILGGPHKKGITGKMLEIAINACEQKGEKVTRIDLYEKKIKYCKGCRVCSKTQECVIMDDDIQEITKLVKECDKIILSAPVYWANVPAAVKNLFDRLNGVAMEETNTFPKPRLSGKKYLILTSSNTPMPFAKIFGQTSGSIRAMKEFFKTAGMKPIGIIALGNAKDIKEIPSNKENKIRKCAIK